MVYGNLDASIPHQHNTQYGSIPSNTYLHGMIGRPLPSVTFVIVTFQTDANIGIFQRLFVFPVFKYEAALLE